MSRKYKDNAATTLAQAITAIATTLQVAAGKGDNFPAVTGHGAAGSAPDYFIITLEDAAANREKIKVEQRAAGSDVLGSVGYPMVRGFDGTAARAWNPGDIVDLRWEASEATDIEDKVQGGGLGRAFGVRGAGTAALNFGYYGGQIAVDGAITTIADGAVALNAASTNYIERTAAGVVSVNVLGFSADKIPLYIVTTDATGISNIADKRAANTPILGGLSKAVAGAAGTIVLTADEARAPIIEFTGVLTGNRIIELPALKREWVIFNNTTGGFTLQVKTNGGTGPVIAQGERDIVYCDGANIVSLLARMTLGYQTLTDAANIAWDMNLGQVAKVTLTASGHTMGAPTNIRPGSFGWLDVIQGGAGNNAMAWNAIFKHPLGAAPALSTAVGARDRFFWSTFDGTAIDITFAKGMA